MNKYKLFGLVGYIVANITYYTLRKKIVKKNGYDFDKKYIYGLWHGKLLYNCLMLRNISKNIAVLVSSSKDGEIIATALRKLGYGLVRGSSNKDSVRSLVFMIKTLREGRSGGFTVDGPKGPIYEVKQGIIYCAQKTATPIVPCGVYCSSKWILTKAWDKFEVPKPFSKITYILGEPMFIPEDGNIEEWSEILKVNLKKLETEAEEIANKK